jgi:hypothetical protein
MKLRPLPQPQIVPESLSTGPSYRSDRVAAQQLARAERRRRKDGKPADRDADAPRNGRSEPLPGKHFDGLA